MGGFCGLFHAFTFPQLGIQLFLTDSQRFRSYLQQFILVDKVQSLFQGQDLRRRQTQRLIGGGRTGVGQMLRLADIQLDVLRFSVLSAVVSGRREILKFPFPVYITDRQKKRRRRNEYAFGISA